MEISISDELNLIVKYAREEAMRTGSYGCLVSSDMRTTPPAPP